MKFVPALLLKNEDFEKSTFIVLVSICLFLSKFGFSQNIEYHRLSSDGFSCALDNKYVEALNYYNLAFPNTISFPSKEDLYNALIVSVELKEYKQASVFTKKLIENYFYTRTSFNKKVFRQYKKQSIGKRLSTFINLIEKE